MFNNIVYLKHPYLGCDAERNKSGWQLHGNTINLFATLTATKKKKKRKKTYKNIDSLEILKFWSARILPCLWIPFAVG